MKRREKKLSVMDWVLVGLLDTLAGVVAGGLMAIWQLPSAYRWRGYWAIGGEWLLVIIAIIMAVRLTPYTIATVIGLLPAHTIYCWIGARLNTLLANDPNPDFQALFAQFWAPMTGVFVLAVVLPFALKGLQALLGGRAKPA